MNISCILNKMCFFNKRTNTPYFSFPITVAGKPYPSLLLKLLKVDEIKDSNIPKMNAHKKPSM